VIAGTGAIYASTIGAGSQTDLTTAQNTADTAVSDADTAQEAADSAQTTATSATSDISDMAADDKLTPMEKLQAKTLWDAVLAEKPGIVTSATNASVSSTTYVGKYDALNTYLNTTPDVFAVMSDTTDITRSTWDTRWKEYYGQKQILLDAIAAALKVIADAGVADAATAQTAANSKSTTYRSNSAPTTPNAGDLWINSTNGGNELYRYDGTDPYNVSGWLSVRDGSMLTIDDLVNQSANQALKDSIQDSFTNNVTVIDGGNITTGTVNAEAINVNSSIEILSDSGNIRSGISYSDDSFPDNTDSITEDGFWLGRDAGKGKFIVGNKDQHIQWDGSALSIQGKLLTGDNIISIDGSSVSTQSFRVTSADIVDGAYGEITNGYRGTGSIDGWVIGESGEDLTYTFEHTVSSSQVGKHFFPLITGNSYYDLSDHDISFSLIDPGTGLSFYEDQAVDGTGKMYVNQNTNTSARYADGNDINGALVGNSRPVKSGGSERYMYRATSVPYQKMGKSITFEGEQKVFFKIFVEPISTSIPGWETLKFEAYASGTEEYFAISTDSTGATHTFNNIYESIQNVQITPGIVSLPGDVGNGAVWFSDLSTTSVKIYSNAASTCHVRAIGY
jgi:hypothetical protein